MAGHLKQVSVKIVLSLATDLMHGWFREMMVRTSECPLITVPIQDSGTLVIAPRYDLMSTKMSLLPVVKGNICGRRAPCLCLTVQRKAGKGSCGQIGYTPPTPIQLASPVLFWDDSPVRRWKDLVLGTPTIEHGVPVFGLNTKSSSGKKQKKIWRTSHHLGLASFVLAVAHGSRSEERRSSWIYLFFI